MPLVPRSALLCLCLAVPASAAVIPGATIDGPSQDIVRMGDLDVSPDGLAAATYVKKDAGIDHVFVARFDGTTWGAPARVDTGSTSPATNPVVTVASGGRTVVTWVAGAPTNQARSAIAPAVGQPFQLVPITSGAADLGVRVDMNDAGIAYATVSSQAVGNRDVSAYRLTGTTWTPVKTDDPVPTAILDAAAADDTGDSGSQGRPDIGVTPDGNAAIAFVGSPNAGETHIYARRIDGLVAHAARKADDLTTLGTAPAVLATTNDMVNLDVESSSRVWIAFRQSFTYGASNRPRIIVRPLDGATLGTPQNPDGLGTAPTEGAENPDIAVNASGLGLLGTPRQLTNEAWGGTLTGGVWSTAGRLDAAPASTSTPRPIVAIGDDGTGLIAWTYAPGGTGTSEIRARVRLAGGTFGAPVTLSDTALGSVVSGDPSIATGVDKTGRGMVAWVQGPPAAVRIVVARTDGPPPPPPVVTPPATVPPVVTPPPPPFDPPGSPPMLSHLTITPRSFRALAAGGPLAPSGGSLISFTLAQSARVTVSVERPRVGRTVRGRCVAPRPKNLGAARCTRWVRVGTRLGISGANGVNTLHLSGRAAGRKLPPGSYRLVVQPVGQPAVRRAFTIIP